MKPRHEVVYIPYHDRFKVYEEVLKESKKDTTLNLDLNDILKSDNILMDVNSEHESIGPRVGLPSKR